VLMSLVGSFHSATLNNMLNDIQDLIAECTRDAAPAAATTSTTSSTSTTCTSSSSTSTTSADSRVAPATAMRSSTTPTPTPASATSSAVTIDLTDNWEDWDDAAESCFQSAMAPASRAAAALGDSSSSSNSSFRSYFQQASSVPATSGRGQTLQPGAPVPPTKVCCGIIYCQKRETCDMLAADLKRANIPCACTRCQPVSWLIGLIWFRVPILTFWWLLQLITRACQPRSAPTFNASGRLTRYRSSFRRLPSEWALMYATRSTFDRAHGRDTDAVHLAIRNRMFAS